MRLLITANSFYPSVGGYERVALLIAEQLQARGMTVRVITLTPEEGEVKLPFEVFRNPSKRMLLRLIRWSDIYIQNNVSLKLLWPMLLVRRPLLFVHLGFYQETDDTTLNWRTRLKHLATSWGGNIAVSRAIAASIPGKVDVCPCPYREDLFYAMPSISRDRDLFFVGRLVSDKGVDLLIEALAALREYGLEPSLTIAGSGPEEVALKRMVSALGLARAVTFVGRVTDEVLNELLNAHKIMVVPTRRGEGFGVVALEGIASGCVVVGSDDGGLQEAIGPCGRVFPRGNSTALAKVLRDLLTKTGEWQQFLVDSGPHLDRHRPAAVVDCYIQEINRIMTAPQE